MSSVPPINKGLPVLDGNSNFLSSVFLKWLQFAESKLNLSVSQNTEGSYQFNTITSAKASSITPKEGMFVFVSDTDATFTSVGFWGYENGSWLKL